jgi:hypothetical protein
MAEALRFSSRFAQIRITSKSISDFALCISRIKKTHRIRPQAPRSSRDISKGRVLLLCEVILSLREVSGFVSRVSCLVFRVSGFGFRVSCLVSRVSGFGSRVLGFGSRVSGSGYRVPGFGYEKNGRETVLRRSNSIEEGEGAVASSARPCQKWPCTTFEDSHCSEAGSS